ncbi:hypothetical protein [Sphingomonas sp. HMP6]|uniref:hypothetical protein n=1 Tax=Sphingomonas sp. HMP6 TaxID=1517551 RepID=UPI001596A1C6|nr:hypothetical protein [Sphingomonas sp. HMP6]BCA58132.1 hypothetical protein HMP06_0901 [Sphingomonas sp. HMP6]
MTEFDEQLSLCHQSETVVAAFLEHLGDIDGARELLEAGARGQGLALFDRPWNYSTHVYGFIEAGRNDDGLIPVTPAIRSVADPSLVGRQIKVTLDGFRVAAYPGIIGKHKVLIDFEGRDQAGAEAQDLRFATVLKVGDKESAAISGLPIFTGLTVPGDGLSFKVRTVLLSNEGDQAIIDVLQSSLFKEGLKLMGTVQPALPQLVALAGGVTQNLIRREWNKQVQEFELGLDFSGSRTSARLRKGSYVVVQVPGENMWRWDRWALDPSTMALVDADGNIAPYNTIVFAVTDSTAETGTSAIRAAGRNGLAVADGKPIAKPRPRPKRSTSAS